MKLIKQIVLKDRQGEVTRATIEIHQKSEESFIVKSTTNRGEEEKEFTSSSDAEIAALRLSLSVVLPYSHITKTEK